MSTNPEQFAPAISERLDYATIDVYLLKYEIVSVSEFAGFQQALQHGSLTNAVLVRKLLPKIFAKPRDFYHALRDNVNDNRNVHTGNKELFHMLPRKFGKKGIIKGALEKFSSKKQQSVLPTIEDPLSSSNNDENFQRLEICSNMSRSASRQSLKPSKPKWKKQSAANVHSTIRRQPSITSLPVKPNFYGNYTGEASDEDSDTESDTEAADSSSEEQLMDPKSKISNSKSGETTPKEAVNDYSLETFRTKLNQGLQSISNDSKFEGKIDSLVKLVECVENFEKRISNIEKAQASIGKQNNKKEHENEFDTEKQRILETFVAEVQKHEKEIEALKGGQQELQKAMQNKHNSKVTEDSLAELQEKTKQIEILKESQHELQSTIQKLESTLREAQREHDNKVTEYTKEIQKYKNLSEAEKRSTVELQETSVAELQEKTKEIEALKEGQHELQSTIQKLESTLREAQREHDNSVTEYTKEIQKYKNLSEAEKRSTVELQETSVAELQEKTKDIEALKEGQHELQSTIQKLESTLREAQREHDNSVTEYTKEIQKYKNLSEAEKRSTVELQETSVAELQEKTKDIEALKEGQHELQSTIQKLESTLREAQREHDNSVTEYTKEIQKYKNLSEAEKRSTVELQETSVAELQEKTKDIEALKEGQHELQSTIQKLESTLREAQREHDNKVTEYTKEIQKYKNLSEAEKRSTVELQETSVAELQEKTKEIEALKEGQHELQSTIQKLESTLREAQREHDNKVTEYTKEIQKYKNLSEAEKRSTVELQETSVAELQEKAKEVEALRASQHELQSTIKNLESTLREIKSEHDGKITEYTKEIQRFMNLSEAEKQKTVKVQETLTAELQKKAKEVEDFKETQHELQSTMKSTLREIKSEHDSKILEYTNEIQKYKNLYEAEKQKTIEQQGILVAELQEKTKEIEALKQSQHELQSTNSQLTLREVKGEHDSKYTEKIQKYDNLNGTENQNAVWQQETSVADLQQKTETSKGSQHEFTSVKQILDTDRNAPEGFLTQQLIDTAGKSPPATKKQTELVSPLKSQLKESQPKEILPAKVSAKDQLAEIQEEKDHMDIASIDVLPSKNQVAKDPTKSDSNSQKQEELQPTHLSRQASKPQWNQLTINFEDEHQMNEKKSATLDNRGNRSSLPHSPLRRTTSLRRDSSSRWAPPNQRSYADDSEFNKGPSSKILTQKPRMFKVNVHVVPKIMDHWKDVALHSLRYDPSMIETLENKNASDPKQCCFDLIEDWLKTEHGPTPKTWETLLTQLRNVEELADRVDDIKKQLK